MRFSPTSGKQRQRTEGRGPRAMKSIVFVAIEAGSAAWMAPVVMALGAAATLFLSEIARAHLARIGRLPETAGPFGVSESAVPELMLKNAGALVSSATGRPAEARIVAAAKARGIPSAQIVDTWGPYARRFGGGWPDTVAVVDERAREEAVREGIPAECIAVIGQPAWADVVALPPAPDDHVAFVGQPIRARYGAALGYDEDGAWRLVCQAAGLAATPIRALRYVLHPEQESMPAAAVAAVQATRDGGEALRACGTVVGAFSSLMVEAAISGRRVVSVQPGAGGEDLCALSRHGRIPRATDPESLVAALARPMRDVGDLRRALAGSTERARALFEAMALR